MQLRILAVGTRMPEWVDEATRDYVRRFPPELKLGLVEVPVVQRGKDIARARQEEGERLLAAIGPRDRVISLCVEGQRWSTEQLAGKLDGWKQEGRDVCFLIGGPDGLDATCIERSEARWSLSPLTLPHALARVVVVEQLYRAWSILAGHPYHRA